MAAFEYLDKRLFDKYESTLFNILADNMTLIAPTGVEREDDHKSWYSAVKDGLRADARRIVLIREGDTERIIGFFQYYTNPHVFMMEEIQIIPEFQGRDNIFRDLYGFVLGNISDSPEFVEAYADKRNAKSLAILHRLGLSVIGENQDGSCYRLRGRYSEILKWYYE